nr:putative leucine-rich repeat receptor-like protein kinase [Quercus suber]
MPFNNSILNESWKGDPCDLTYPWYGIQCSTKGHIIGIELNDMGLSWKVDVNEFMNFPELIILSFQNNSLWGNVMNFSFNHKMKIINLSGNKLDGTIPGSLLSLSVLESLQLQDNNLTVAVILLLILYCQKAQMVKKMLNEANKEEAGEGEKIIEAAERSIVVVAEESRNLVFMEDEPAFDIRDVLRASAEGLGKGIFGNSYKAKHSNLLPLLAYYYSNEEKFLLYNYAAKGNLFDRIHGERGGDRIPFRWDARLSVARGIARALEYLHHNTKSQSMVPHGNLKSSNVLFGENDKVLVSDYGLASLLALPIAIQHMVSYKSPEYRNGRKVSKQSDVWSYGCLLSELLTGKISARTAPPGVNGTVDPSSWVHRVLREEWTAEVFDLEISMQRNAVPGMLRLLQIAMQCFDNTPEERPEMTQVVRVVENIKVPESGDENDGSLEDGSLSTSGTGEEK